MKAQFIVDYVLKDEHRGTANQTAYKAGQVIDMSEASFAHFESRDLVKEYKEPKRTAPETDAPSRPAAKASKSDA